jgi:hypothetical protein
LELGVGNGLENNTLILLAMGWTGAWVGGEALAFDHTNSRLSFVRDWITRENVASLANSALRMMSASLEIVQVASIDLDGNDFHIVKELLRSGLEPDLFIVEYNAKFPPPLEFVMKYDASHKWKGGDYFGASLQSWENLLSTCGYQCVACNLTGLNAFFVNKKHSQHFADVSGHGASAHYVTGRYVTLPQSGPPTSPLTVATLARYQNSP